MSLWISRYKCINCGSEISVQGGMVNSVWMGPPSDKVVCPNPSCNAVGFKSFKILGPINWYNPDHKKDIIVNDHMDNT